MRMAPLRLKELVGKPVLWSNRLDFNAPSEFWTHDDSGGAIWCLGSLAGALPWRRAPSPPAALKHPTGLGSGTSALNLFSIPIRLGRIGTFIPAYRAMPGSGRGLPVVLVVQRSSGCMPTFARIVMQFWARCVRSRRLPCAIPPCFGTSLSSGKGDVRGHCLEMSALGFCRRALVPARGRCSPTLDATGLFLGSWSGAACPGPTSSRLGIHGVSAGEGDASPGLYAAHQSPAQGPIRRVGLGMEARLSTPGAPPCSRWCRWLLTNGTWSGRFSASTL